MRKDTEKRKKNEGKERAEEAHIKEGKKDRARKGAIKYTGYAREKKEGLGKR